MIDLSLYFNDVKIRDFNTSEIDIILNYRKIFENYYSLKNMVCIVMKNYNLYKKFLRTQKKKEKSDNIIEANRLILNLLGSIYSLCELFLKQENLFNTKDYKKFKKLYDKNLKIKTLMWLRHAIIHNSLLLTHSRQSYPYYRISLLDIELKYKRSKKYSQKYKEVIPRLKKFSIYNYDFNTEINTHIKNGIYALKDLLNKYSICIFNKMQNIYIKYCKLLHSLNNETKTMQYSDIKILKCKSQAVNIAPFILEKTTLISELSKNKDDFIKQLFLEYKNI